ncbi:MAG TPA: ABC transporter ATP-binding protein, partial [Bryobacteraceae bacterium]|nr:ABC transporter ATP-binding protein [Bryobacteraceae bacterium]
MRQTFRRLYPYLWKCRRGLALGMGALLAKDALAALQPLIIGACVDSLTRGFAMSKVWTFAGLLATVSALKGLFQYWMRVILIGMSRDIEYELRQEMFAHLESLSWDFYARFRTGDIMARSTNDLNAVRMMLGPGLMYWTETMITFIIAIGVMAAVDWRLTLIAMLPTPVVSLVVVVFGRMIHTRFERIQAMFSDISNRVQENFSGVRMLRAYVQEAAELQQFETLNRRFINENISLARAQGMFMPLLQALIAIAFLVVLWAGGNRLLAGKITLGNFVMFNTYMGMLVWPMIALGWVVNLMQRGNASLARITEMIDEQPSIRAPQLPTDLPEIRGEVEFRDAGVQFGSTEVLANVSLRIPSGATVAVVGHTGSGKSTLMHLIPRLIDPTRGSVLVDGISIRDVDPAQLRRHIGFVPQETFLFSATLGENIAFGVEHATKEQIERAADLAGLATDVSTFPNGFDTVVGERGITLSGGQKQRTAIARAILRDPRILILDDALSSVDTLTEERILT